MLLKRTVPKALFDEMTTVKGKETGHEYVFDFGFKLEILEFITIRLHVSSSKISLQYVF